MTHERVSPPATVAATIDGAAGDESNKEKVDGTTTEPRRKRPSVNKQHDPDEYAKAIGAAIALIQDRPELSDVALAKECGLTRHQLGRDARFKAARQTTVANRRQQRHRGTEVVDRD